MNMSPPTRPLALQGNQMMFHPLNYLEEKREPINALPPHPQGGEWWGRGYVFPSNPLGGARFTVDVFAPYSRQ